jgi:hypothetical protein
MLRSYTLSLPYPLNLQFELPPRVFATRSYARLMARKACRELSLPWGSVDIICCLDGEALEIVQW